MSQGWSLYTGLTVQVALVIRGFAIRGFDYTRTIKQGKIANNEGKNTVSSQFMHKVIRRFQISLENIPRE